MNKSNGCDIKISSEKKPVSIFRREARTRFSERVLNDGYRVSVETRVTMII